MKHGDIFIFEWVEEDPFLKECQVHCKVIQNQSENSAIKRYIYRQRLVLYLVQTFYAS